MRQQAQAEPQKYSSYNNSEKATPVRATDSVIKCNISQSCNNLESMDATLAVIHGGREHLSDIILGESTIENSLKAEE